MAVGGVPHDALVVGLAVTGAAVARQLLVRGHRVLACAVIADPASTFRTVVASPASVAQRVVDDQTMLVSPCSAMTPRPCRGSSATCA